MTGQPNLVISPEFLDELERLHGEATPEGGPEFSLESCNCCLVVGKNDTEYAFLSGMTKVWEELTPQLAAYIAAACNAVPGLIAEIRRQAALLDEYEHRVSIMYDYLGEGADEIMESIDEEYERLKVEA